MTISKFPVRSLPTCVALALGLALLPLAGCSGGSKSVSVSGKVMYKGAPVTGGTLTLHPTDGKGAGTTITIDPSGTFSMNEIPTGPKTVTIETESIKSTPTGNYAPPPGMKPPAGADPGKQHVDASNLPKYVPIPKKYANPTTSQLTWDIGKGKNDKTFELSD